MINKINIFLLGNLKQISDHSILFYFSQQAQSITSTASNLEADQSMWPHQRHYVAYLRDSILYKGRSPTFEINTIQNSLIKGWDETRGFKQEKHRHSSIHPPIPNTFTNNPTGRSNVQGVPKRRQCNGKFHSKQINLRKL